MHQYYQKAEVDKKTNLSYKYSYFQDGLYITHRLQQGLIDVLKKIDSTEREGFNNYLDLGCGQGNWMNFMNIIFNGKINIYGIDISEHQINVLNTKFPNYHAECMNITKLTYENEQFDLITAFTSFMFLKNEEELTNSFKNIHRVLKKGGYFILEDVYKKKGHFNGHELKEKGFCGYEVKELDEVATKYGLERIAFQTIFKRLLWSKRSKLNTVNLPSYIGYKLTYLSELFIPGEMNNFIILYKKVK